VAGLLTLHTNILPALAQLQMYMRLQNHNGMDTGSNMSITPLPLAGRHAWMHGFATFENCAAAADAHVQQ
jgi:hypothetical protein